MTSVDNILVFQSEVEQEIVRLEREVFSPGLGDKAVGEEPPKELLELFTHIERLIEAYRDIPEQRIKLEQELHQLEIQMPDAWVEWCKNDKFVRKNASEALVKAMRDDGWDIQLEHLRKKQREFWLQLKQQYEKLWEDLLNVKSEKLDSISQIMLARKPEFSLHELWTIMRLRDRIVQQQATELVANKNFRYYLCSGLKTASNDSFEIAKIITPILIGLVTAGTITIPLTPILFASIALVITRASISSICADFDKGDRDKK